MKNILAFLRLASFSSFLIWLSFFHKKIFWIFYVIPAAQEKHNLRFFLNMSVNAHDWILNFTEF